jgi:hypothetical protein
VELRIDDISHYRWQALAAHARLPFQQSWEYGAAVEAIGGRIIRVEVHDQGRAIAIAQGLCRSFLLPVTLITRGPVWIGSPDEREKVSALRALRSGLKGALLVTPAVGQKDVQRRAGFTKIVTPSTLALLDLDAGMRQRLRGKWRNRLVKAEGAGLKLHRSQHGLDDLQWLLAADARQQREKGYRALPQGFAEAWSRHAPQSVLGLTAHRGTERVAAMLFLRHGNTATYHIGWSNETGRKVSAHNLLLWQAMCQLAEDGVASLDLGLIDTERAPGLARFKLGSGARPVPTGGTWLGW